MKKVFVLKFALLAILGSVFALYSAASAAESSFFSKAKPFTIEAQSEKSDKSEILKIALQDAKAKPGVCPYYVRSLQYVRSLKALSIEVFQENCLNDAFGISKGQVLWVVPGSLKAKGTSVSVLINNTKAGALVYDDSKNAFSVQGD